jgi:hypothetical protein
MRNVLYIIAAVLLVFWIAGAFFSTVGNAIHLLLLLALASFVFGHFRRDRDLTT